MARDIHYFRALNYFATLTYASVIKSVQYEFGALPVKAMKIMLKKVMLVCVMQTDSLTAKLLPLTKVQTLKLKQ